MRKTLRLGVMGGTFDPIHFGHLVTAEEALVQFNLDKVVFMPTGKPVAKAHRDVSPAEDRYLMAVLATASNPDFEVSRMEIERPGETYTVDTMVAMRKLYGPRAELYFITGADAVREILTWKDAVRFAGLCSFIAATRPGFEPELGAGPAHPTEDAGDGAAHPTKSAAHPTDGADGGEAVRRGRPPEKLPKVEYMEVPALAISSSDIRERVRTRRPVRYLLPESVAAHIRKNGLYRESGV